MRTTLTCLLLGTLCASGLANAQAERVSIGISDSAGVSIGASLVPPTEAGWKLTRNGGSIDISKAGASDHENSQIEAYLIRLDQPEVKGGDRIAIVKANIEKSYSAPDSLKVVRMEVASDARLKQCIRVHLILMRAAQDASQPSWYSDKSTLSCTFNAIGVAGVEVNYFQRYFAKQPDLSIAAKAKIVLDSVNLVDKR